MTELESSIMKTVGDILSLHPNRWDKLNDCISDDSSWPINDSTLIEDYEFQMPLGLNKIKLFILNDRIEELVKEINKSIYVHVQYFNTPSSSILGTYDNTFMKVTINVSKLLKGD